MLDKNKEVQHFFSPNHWYLRPQVFHKNVGSNSIFSTALLMLMLKPVLLPNVQKIHLYVCYVCCSVKTERWCLTIVQYKTVLNIFDKKNPFANTKGWLSYLTVSNPNGMFLCSLFDIKAGLIQEKKTIYFLQHVSKPSVKNFPGKPGNIMQQFNNKIASMSVHTVWMSITVLQDITHYPWKNTALIITLPLNAVFHLISLSKHFSIWEMEKLHYLGLKCLLFVDVLMSDDFVGDPVEDVEDEECQRKGSPGDSVYPLGSVHKLLLHGFNISGDWLLRVWSWGSVFNSWAILRWQSLTHIVASEIKAALTHIFILKSTKAHVDRAMLPSDFKRLQLECYALLLNWHWLSGLTVHEELLLYMSYYTHFLNVKKDTLME